MKDKKYIAGFTLIEISIGILIFSFVAIAGFQALGSVGIGKIKLMSKINTQKQVNYFSQKFFEEIKKGGKIDYEEYFNRKVVGTDFLDGHYKYDTGFGNFGNLGNPGGPGIYNPGEGFYHCISGDGNQIQSGSGCYDNSMNDKSEDFSSQPQRYGQYGIQFIDYNSNSDSDGGDEDGNGNILGDYDDENLGEGPGVFASGTDVKELYLISGDKKKRTIFRWKVYDDPDAPYYDDVTKSNGNCDYSNQKAPTGSGCLGTIEFLKLEGRDWGMNHDILNSSTGSFDGIIDTWVISKDFLGLDDDVVIGSNTEDYWLPLFPDTINVSDFKIFPYPNKDLALSWKDYDPMINVSPYVMIQLSFLPSWKVKKAIRGNPREIKFATTIALTDIFSR